MTIVTTQNLLEYPWNGYAPIPIAVWGKDHWGTFSYAEAQCLAAAGKLQSDRMRCNAKRHPHLIGTDTVVGEHYPTRLKNACIVTDHDDWDCLNDAVLAGFLEIVKYPNKKSGYSLNGNTVTVKMTPLGNKMVRLLREHKENGGVFHTFTPTKL